MLDPSWWDHDPHFEPEWCERCNQKGHNEMNCLAEEDLDEDED